MTEWITVVALRPVNYDGLAFVRGDVFLVTPVQAAVMTYAQDVRFAQPGEVPPPPAVKDPIIAPPPAVEAPVVVTAPAPRARRRATRRTQAATA